MSKISKILTALSALNAVLLFVFIILAYNSPDKSTFSIYAFSFAFVLALLDGGVMSVGYYIDHKDKK